ncbi:MAG: aldehyde dehydrogenase family protein [Planctomycetaceae bacterium]|nr:aldehyde dehydrogenase family protein [Planctomycetaceae bacterium]
MATANILVNGSWVPSKSEERFQAVNPATGEAIGMEYPVSQWEDLDAVLNAAQAADEIVRDWPGSRFAQFLEAYADEIEVNADELAEVAHQETALPHLPRLRNGEIPRTTGQLRQAADAARSGDWASPVIDEENNLRSMLRSIGPVIVFGPNNFPFAFNGISGGDFAAAVAAGNPVIAKGHPSHPETTRLLAEAALKAAQATDFPPGFVQLVYRMPADLGIRLIKDPRLAAVGYTGGLNAGLKIKAAADEVGKPAYLELSSINPVFVLPSYLSEKADDLVDEFTGSCLMGSGQFCTNPGLVILPPGEETATWIGKLQQKFSESNCAPLLSGSGQKSFLENVKYLTENGAQLLTGGEAADGPGFAVQSTLLQVSAEQFLNSPETFQREVFGNGSLLVTTSNLDQMIEIARTLEGQLTGTVYLSQCDEEDAFYSKLEPVLRRKVGRLLNNKMPTGVAVSPAMNHGGPFPATGHPGFTAVGIPASVRRFAMLQSYDNIPTSRLPEALKS